MDTTYITSQTKRQQPCVATVGFFDGVHRGHKYLISHVTADAKAMGLRSVVVTFDNHPRQALCSDYVPQRLTTLEGKLRLLSETGIDETTVLHFDKAMAGLSARDFMRDILKGRLNVVRLVIGYDNRFGHNRAEGFDDYVRYGRELGIEVVHNNAFILQSRNVSSSLIRRYLAEGEVEMASAALGYDYSIAGRVVGGYHEGRLLGFPTANINNDDGLMLPAPGVYAVRAKVEGEAATHHAMMNIGTRPTFGGTKTTLETNIFDFDENIYGKTLKVSFAHRIRQEQRFASPEELKQQLVRDRETIEKQFEKDNDL